MPEKEGIETIIELKREFTDVKIIAISGGDCLNAKNYLDIAKRLKVARTFEKPFDREELLEAIQELLASV